MPSGLCAAKFFLVIFFVSCKIVTWKRDYLWSMDCEYFSLCGPWNIIPISEGYSGLWEVPQSSLKNYKGNQQKFLLERTIAPFHRKTSCDKLINISFCRVLQFFLCLLEAKQNSPLQYLDRMFRPLRFYIFIHFLFLLSSLANENITKLWKQAQMTISLSLQYFKSIRKTDQSTRNSYTNQMW